VHSKFAAIRIQIAVVPASGHCRQVKKPTSRDKTPLIKSHTASRVTVPERNGNLPQTLTDKVGHE
jgi:hypothetical protein